MKAILEFNLDEHDDIISHKRCVLSLDLCGALWDLDQYLRSQTKYNDNLTPEAWDALDSARDKFYEILNQRNINLDELLS